MENWNARCAAARSQFQASGTNISEWARAHGFEPRLVHMILGGNRRCLRGESHRIAVALGLKPQVPVPNVRVLPTIMPVVPSNRRAGFDGRDRHTNGGGERFYGTAAR